MAVESGVPEGELRRALGELLGREPRGGFEVVVTTGDGAPVVIENEPFLDDGTPMPTLFWLVGRPELRAVSRLESSGGVTRASREVDPDALEEAHRRYRALREGRVPAGHRGPRPSGGVGGTARGVKCLHCHLAWFLAGGDDPVGRWTATELSLDLARYRRCAGHGEQAT